jgi:hypothetical protein
MRFRCTTDYAPKIFDPADYVYSTTVEILCPADDESDDDVIGGKVGLEHLDIGRAINARQDLFEICDAKSHRWYHIHRAVFQRDTYGLKDEFDFGEPLISLVYVRHFVLHPELRPWQGFVLDSLAHPYGYESALVMWRGQTNLSDTELTRLGFRVIARTDLLFRPNMDRHEYEADRDERDVFKLQLGPSVADFVEAEWQRAQQCL